MAIPALTQPTRLFFARGTFTRNLISNPKAPATSLQQNSQRTFLILSRPRHSPPKKLQPQTCRINALTSLRLKARPIVKRHASAKTPVAIGDASHDKPRVTDREKHTQVLQPLDGNLDVPD